MERYLIEKPSFDRKKWINALDKIEDWPEFDKFSTRTSSPEYLNWDKIKYLPRPDSLTAEEFWLIVKGMRKFGARIPTVIESDTGDFFTLQTLTGQDQTLHTIDLDLGGTMTPMGIDDEREKHRFMLRGVMEEAIASSQLEGAATTRRVAKRMINEKRKPRNESEQMILNNYETMIAIEDEKKHLPLTKNLLLELHTTLTSKTISQDEVGRFRRDSDNVVVVSNKEEIVLHVPPSEQFLLAQLDRLIEYANDKIDDATFVHPVLKAILLHFWIGYLHPFTDGNGRLARALFYWYLLRHDYWAFSYLPLSRVIKNSPGQYRDAYIYSEQDDFDVTYFVDYNLRKISQARRDFMAYLERKGSENRRMALVAKSHHGLTRRQIQLLQHLHKNAGAHMTIALHSRMNDIVFLTARKDLVSLEEQGFLTSAKVGRERRFTVSSKVRELFGDR